MSYSPSVRLCHGVSVPVKTRPEDDFAFNMDEVRRAWQPGCKAIIINFPTNPTGVLQIKNSSRSSQNLHAKKICSS